MKSANTAAARNTDRCDVLVPDTRKGPEERFPYDLVNRADRGGASGIGASGSEPPPVSPAVLLRANGGFNLNWGWHFYRVNLVEVAVEVCDGTPSMVQANLNYWLTTVRNFCPWAAYVDAESSRR